MSTFFTHSNPQVQKVINRYLTEEEKFVKEVNERNLAQDERAMSMLVEINQTIWQIRKEHIHNETTFTTKFGPLLSDESILEILKKSTQKLLTRLEEIKDPKFKFQKVSSETSTSYMYQSPDRCLGKCTKFNRQVCNV